MIFAFRVLLWILGIGDNPFKVEFTSTSSSSRRKRDDEEEDEDDEDLELDEDGDEIGDTGEDWDDSADPAVEGD